MPASLAPYEQPVEAVPCPKMNDNQKKGTVWRRKSKSLEKHVYSLQRQCEELSLRNSQLQSRERILISTCRCLNLVGSVLSVVSGSNALVKDAASALEADINALVEAWQSDTDGPSATAIEAYPKLEQVPGGSESFILQSINKQHILGPCSRALLQGQPLSLLECTLLAFGTDAHLRQDLLQSIRLDPEVKSKLYEVSTEEGRKNIQAFAYAQDAQAKRQAAAGIAGWFVFGLSAVVGVYIMDPKPYFFQGLISEDSSHPLSQHLGTARLMQLTDHLGLSSEQRDEILAGLHVYANLQKPLDQEEAALLLRIHQLLQLPHGLPGSNSNGGLQCSPSFAAAPPLAASATALSLQDAAKAAAGTAAAARLASVSGSASGSAGCSSCQPQPVPSDACGQFMLSSAHHELKPLLLQLQKVQYKLHWLDVCVGFFVAGCLTWEQNGRFIVESWPNPGSLIPFARSLVLRDSLRWLHVVEAEYGRR
jgi:hypothetical protein